MLNVKTECVQINSKEPDQASICSLEGNSRNTRKRYEICSKLAIKTLGQRL